MVDRRPVRLGLASPARLRAATGGDAGGDLRRPDRRIAAHGGSAVRVQRGRARPRRFRTGYAGDKAEVGFSIFDLPSFPWHRGETVRLGARPRSELKVIVQQAQEAAEPVARKLPSTRHHGPTEAADR